MSVGFGQALLILLVVFVLFGAGKLPAVMGDLGKGMRAFKKGLAGDDEISTPDGGLIVVNDHAPDQQTDKAGQA